MEPDAGQRADRESSRDQNGEDRAHGRPVDGFETTGSGLLIPVGRAASTTTESSPAEPELRSLGVGSPTAPSGTWVDADRVVATARAGAKVGHSSGPRPAPTPKKKGRPRVEASPEQARALVAICGVAGLIALAMSAAPTGHGAVDALLRTGFVVTMTLAGSRARRWSLAVAAAVAMGFSSGWAILLGLAALAVVTVLVGTMRRDRVYGAAVGALSGLGLLTLHPRWFVAAPTLLGVAAAAGILISGYRNASSIARRRWRRAGTVTGVVVALLLVGVALIVANEDARLRSAVRSNSAGIAALRAGHGAEAAVQFKNAATGFGEIDDAVSSWWLWPARAVPVLAQNLDAVSTAATAGEDLTSTAATMSVKVDYARLLRADGGLDLTLFESFRQPIEQSARALERAQTAVSSLTSPWIVGPLQRRLADFQGKAHQIRNEADLARLALDRAPAILGADGTRRYLVMLSNPAEARDLGGHIGNWAILSLVDGKPSLDRVGQPQDLALPEDTAIPDADRYPPELVNDLKAVHFPQNWGGSPDLPTDARLASELVQLKTGTTIDGVLYADPDAFASILTLTGPVTSPGAPITLTSKNAAEFLTREQFHLLPLGHVGDSVLTELIRTTFDRLTHLKLPRPSELGATFGPLVHQGRLQFASLHAADNALLDRLGMVGAVPRRANLDVVGAVVRDQGTSKIDSFLHRTTTVHVGWDPRTGSVDEQVRVTLRNDAPTTGWSRTVIGNDLGLPFGTNLAEVSLLTTYAPQQGDQVLVDGVASPSRPALQEGYWREAVSVTIAPGSTAVVIFHRKGHVKPGPSYSVAYVGQPLVQRGQVDMTIDAAAGSVRSWSGNSVDGRSAEVSLPDDTDATESLVLAR